MAKGIQRKLNKVYAKVDEDIRAFARHAGIYAGGLASEGYNGGYADALQDVMLALRGIRPNRRHWWQDVEFDE